MLLKENITGSKAIYKTKFRFSKSKSYYIFKFKCFNSKLNSFSDKYNDTLYKADVCEVFIKYGKENHYYEVEVAPNGTVFLSDIENIDGKFSGNLIEKCFVKTSAKCGKNKYKVTIKIPRDLIKTTRVEFNAFRIETDGSKPEAHLFALRPTLCGSFHKIEYIK